MAQNRYISTNFWKDNYVIDLDPTEKLLFIYFLTNPKTNIAGTYEINLREVAFDTGIDKDMVQKIVSRFQKDGKMMYKDGWLIIKNWIKHQQLNPSVRKGIDRYLKLLPDIFKEYVLTDDDGYSVGIAYDSLYTESDIYKLKPKLKYELELNTNAATADDGTKPKKDIVRIPTKHIDGLFDYWEQVVGYRIKTDVKTNREYASKILKEYSKEEVVLMIHNIAIAVNDKYAPRIANFRQLYRKWDDMELWIQRESRQAKSKVNKRGFTVGKK